jgi:hypothetical protein
MCDATLLVPFLGRLFLERVRFGALEVGEDMNVGIRQRAHRFTSSILVFEPGLHLIKAG